MKTNLTSVEIHFLEQELKIIEQGKVDSIYHPRKEELYLVLHVPRRGKHILKILNGRFCFLAKKKRSHSIPSGFCQALRKHLLNATLKSITQCESERILKATFQKEKQIHLYIELFAKGNIILADAENTILAPLTHATFKGRTLRPKATYSYPAMPINVFKLREQDLVTTLKNSNKTLVRSLATEVGIGGTYAEEICLRADLPKTKKARILNREETSAITKKIKQLLQQESHATIILEHEEIIDCTPIQLLQYQDHKKKPCETYSEALDEYSTKYLEVREKSPKEKAKEKVERILATQHTHLKQIDLKSREEQRKGELIYENYQLLSKLIEQIQEATRSMTLQEIRKKLRHHKIVKDLDPKEKTITVEF